MEEVPQIIDHRYHFVAHIGSGMSGQVLLVEDRQGQKALKFLNSVQLNLSRDEALANFKSEVAILKKLNHPHIAPILDFGYDEGTRRYYFTSEYIEGKNIFDACHNQPIEVIEKIFIQVLRAFHYLHSRGVYHLDVKPQNILVRMRGDEPDQAKIIDFGLAGLDNHRRLAGTPTYMAPEVVRGGVLDGRTDLYSLGITFYKVFTDINPFMHKDVREILARQISLSPQPASTIEPTVPTYWDHILERLLEKNPSDRYPQAALVIRDLAFLSGKKIEVESEDTKISYLPEKGVLIGREKQWQEFTRVFSETFFKTLDHETRLIVIHGEKGSGKSRFAAEIRYDAQIKGVPVYTQKDLEMARANGFAPRQFVLLLDEGMSLNDLHVVLQELSQCKALVVWLIEGEIPLVTGALVIRLENYSRDELKVYLESVTGLPQIPLDWIDEIYSRTRGNPLFVTEVVKALLAEDVLADYSAGWDRSDGHDVRIDFSRIPIPSSLEEILSNQYQSLSEAEKTILDVLALHAGPMRKSDLAQVIGGNIKGSFDALVLNLLIGEDPEERYDFLNLLSREVIVAQIEKPVAARWHERLALVFADYPAERKSYLYHLGHAGDPLKAREAWRELSRLLQNEADYQPCIFALERLLACCEAGWNELSRESILRLAEVYNLNRQYESAIRFIQEELDKVEPQVGPWVADFKFALRQQMIDCAIKQSHVSEPEHYRQLAAKQCLLAGEALLPASACLIVKNYQAYLKMIGGDLAGAETDFEQAHRAWCQDLDFTDRLKVVNNRLVDVYLLRQKYREAIHVCEDRIAVFEFSNQHSSLSAAHYALGGVYYKLATLAKEDKEDQIDKCLVHFRRGEKIAERIRHDNLRLCTLNGLGNAYLLRGEPELALSSYFQALKIARQIHELETAGLVAFNISNIYRDRGETRDSYSFLVYVVNTFSSLTNLSPNSHFILYWSHLSLCDHFLQKGNVARAGDNLKLAQKLYNTHDYLHSQEYWLAMRSALFKRLSGDTLNWQEDLTRVCALAKTHEEEEDMEQCLNWKVLCEPVVKTRTNLVDSSKKQDSVSAKIDFGRRLLRCHGEDEILREAALAMGELCGASRSVCLKLRSDGQFAVHPLLNFLRSDEHYLDLELCRSAMKGSSLRYADRDVDGMRQQVVAVPLTDGTQHYGVLYFVCETGAAVGIQELMQTGDQVFAALSRCVALTDAL